MDTTALKNTWGRVTAIPLVFLGVGVYRAWIATLFMSHPLLGDASTGYILFEAAIGVTSIVMALSARRIGPISTGRFFPTLSAIFMVCGAGIGAFVYLAPSSSPVLLLFCEIVAGCGCGLLILLWAEFFGSLNPLRVALYHSGALIFGEFLQLLLIGYVPGFLLAFSLVLPIVSVIWLRRSMQRIPLADRPKRIWGEGMHNLPWKIILLMGLCAFASAYGGTYPQMRLLGNAPGVLIAAGLVFVGVLSVSKRFNFGVIYQIALPAMVIGLLLIMPALGLGDTPSGICFDAGYTALSILVMLVLSNITYRFGISAVWLSGIERGVRYLAEVLGWGLSFYLVNIGAPRIFITRINMLITAVVTIAFAVIFFSEKGLTAKWGISLRSPGDGGGVSSPQSRLAMRVSDLAKGSSLSPREEEVLQLLARRESIAQIEEDLCIAEGTAKAHLGHIYSKLGIHSRNELYVLLGIGDHDTSSG